MRTPFKLFLPSYTTKEGNGKKRHKDHLNALRNDARVLRDRMRSLTPELLEAGVHLGLAVEATNLSFSYDKIINELDKVGR